MILFLSALLGLISVAFGAYAEHHLRAMITQENFQFLMTALRYNQINAVMSSAIGLMLLYNQKIMNTATLKWSGLLFITGTFLFSFSIYISISLNLPILLKLAPIGGIIIMVSWLLLAISALQIINISKN